MSKCSSAMKLPILLLPLVISTVSISFENEEEDCDDAKCQKGWKYFERPSGGWCMKVFFYDQINYDLAQEKCGEQGAVLSGFQNQMEASFVNFKAIEHFIPTFASVLIGLRRIPACQNVGRTANCTAWNSFAWTDDSATGTDGILWSNQQPDNAHNRKQHCVVMMASTSGYVDGNWAYQSGTFDDIVCEKEAYPPNSSMKAYVCGKKSN